MNAFDETFETYGDECIELGFLETEECNITDDYMQPQNEHPIADLRQEKSTDVIDNPYIKYI